jgi:hypothetical protein
MTILNQYQDLSGRWIVVCSIDINTSIMFQFLSRPTIQQITDTYNAYIASPLYVLRNVRRVPITIELNQTVISNVITYIRANGPLTLAQWTIYLGTLQWYDSNAVTWFMYALAVQLASIHNITLANYTETEVLGKLQTWIINASMSLLNRIVWGT